MSDYILRSVNYDKEICVDNIYSQYQDSRKNYQQNDNERQKWHLDNGNPTTTTTEEGNTSFFEELEKILSAQVQIVNIARQNALKVKGSCGIPQRLHIEPKAKLFDAKATLNQNLMADGLPSAGIDSIARCGTMIEPNNNVVTDMHENTFLFNYPPNMQVSQPIQHCLATPEMHMNHATIKSQFIPSKEEMNVKDLQKRAAHNKIEKRRRSFINDKISELQSLLPEDVNRTSCHNKGSILKESVDYIKKLQSDFAVIKQLKEKISEIDLESKQMAKRLEMLEMRTSSDVVNTKSPDNVQNISTTLEDSTNMRFDSGMIECLPKVLPTMSQSVDLDDILNTLASTFKDN